MQTFIPFPWFPGVEVFYLPGRQEVPVVLQTPSCHLLVVDFDLISSIGANDQSVNVFDLERGWGIFQLLLDIFGPQALQAPLKTVPECHPPPLYTNILHHIPHPISVVNPIETLDLILLSTHSFGLS